MFLISCQKSNSQTLSQKNPHRTSLNQGKAAYDRDCLLLVRDAATVGQLQEAELRSLKLG